ncbi:MAG: hemerythrin domain-containing protein [archaeon]|nr:hemerythrin domain-containing protein [archaeon]
MSYRLDYAESVCSVAKRLKQEHEEIDRKLGRISKAARTKNGNPKVVVSLLNAVKIQILRHAVEEEARLARVIMESSEIRKKSDESVRILQEHRRIKEFLEDELPYLLDENSEKEARKKIVEFTELMIRHHMEEEKEVFPLALRATSNR